MARIRLNIARESIRDARIQAEIGLPVGSVVAWRSYVIRATAFPFTATYLAQNTTKPFCSGAKVQVIGLAKEEQSNVSLFAKVMDGQGSILIPLERLEPFGESVHRTEAVRDWHYWCRLSQASG